MVLCYLILPGANWLQPPALLTRVPCVGELIRYEGSSYHSTYNSDYRVVEVVHEPIKSGEAPRCMLLVKQDQPVPASPPPPLNVVNDDPPPFPQEE